ncbi:MAG: IPT/TIG domain-containing protein [Candidatus Krumholzibacteriaceae bacterium]
MNKAHFRACIILVGFLAALAGCGNDTSTIVMRPPGLSTISPATSAYGDTIVVTGSGFGTDPSATRIVISPGRFSEPVARRVAVPFGGSRTTLRAIVPDGAFAGSVRVEQAEPLGGAFGFGVQPPATASNALPFSARLVTGNVGKSFFSGSSYTFSLTAGASSEDYLVVLFSSAVAPDNTWTCLYSATAQSATALAGGSPAAASGSPRGVSGEERSAARQAGALNDLGLGQREFKQHVNEEIAGLLAKSGGAHGTSSGLRAFRSPVSGPGAAPQTTAFQMLIDPNKSVLDVTNFATIQANLKYTGDHTLLYVDAETPSEFLSDADAENLGQMFDASIYGTDRSYFGNESDINHDGKVAILMSPAVNRMTPAGAAGSQGFIAGYFLANDLLPGLLDSRITNGMEIFYTMVPDPSSLYGNLFPKDKTLPVIEGVLAHEFLHMILFNYRVLIYGNGYLADYMEKLWLDEGLAHIAEDLNGFKSSNIARANLFLQDPGDVTLIYGGDELEERGASFLFLRLLGDRFGTSVYKRLVQSRRTGTANVEAATGALFNELFADWDAACYLSGRGITADDRFNYSSIDLQGDFKPLYTVAGNVSGLATDGFVKSMAPEYIMYTVPAGGTVDFTIGSDQTGRMNAAVIRLR